MGIHVQMTMNLLGYPRMSLGIHGTFVRHKKIEVDIIFFGDIEIENRLAGNYLDRASSGKKISRSKLVG